MDEMTYFVTGEPVDNDAVALAALRNAVYADNVGEDDDGLANVMQIAADLRATLRKQESEAEPMPEPIRSVADFDAAYGTPGNNGQLLFHSPECGSSDASSSCSAGGGE